MKIRVLVILLVMGSVLEAQTPGDVRSRIVSFAQQFLGVPYVYGAASPAGFDCTGLIYYTYKEVAGLTIPRSTRHLAAFGTKITLAQALPGDVLIFNTIGGPSHAGIYIGDNQVLHAASAGSKTGVIISRMTESYYATRFLYGREILGKAAVLPPPTTPESDDVPELPLTTFRIDLGPRALRNYDRLPFLAGTMAEFEILSPQAEILRVQLVKGDWEGGRSSPVWEESVTLEPGQVYRTGKTVLKDVTEWALVVTNLQNQERGVRIFRSVKELP